MRDLHGGSPLVQEATGGVEATVPHACLPLKVLAHAVTVVVVAHARLLCGEAEFGMKTGIFSSQRHNARLPTKTLQKKVSQ